MSKTSPLVSVIMPVYNGSQYVSEAISSVLNQTFHDFELIVIDDGSTDQTLAKLKQFDRNIKLIRNSHTGVSHARNTGIEASHGRYIAFIDSDDLWEPSKLALQVDYLNSHSDVGLVYSYSSNFTDNTEGNVSLVKKVDHQGYAFKNMFLKGGLANSTVMIRRDVLATTGAFDESLVAMEDFDLYLRISRHFKIGRIPKPLMRRRIHPDSFYTSGYDNQYIYQYPVYERLLSDPAVEREIGTTQTAFMTNFILRFIFKNIYDGHPEFTARKLHDLKRFAPFKSPLTSVLVKLRITSPALWRLLITDFDHWYADVKHKAALFEERRKSNFNAGGF